MRPVTYTCAARQCSYLIWETIGPERNMKRRKRRRICGLAGTVPSYLLSCPSGLLTEGVIS